MRKAAPFLALLLLAACGQPAGSALRFASERVDLGVLHQHDRKEFAIPFEVTGDAPVSLTSIEVSCGCTDVAVVVDGKTLLLAEKKLTATAAAPSASGEEEALKTEVAEGSVVLPQGTRGEVRGTYDPGPRLNEQIVTISLRGSMLNSPARTELRAQLKPLYVLEPAQLLFGTQVDAALRAQSRSQEVLVRAARPFTLKGWKRVPNCLRIEDLGEVASVDGAGPARRFRFTLDGSAPLGVYDQLVSAATDLGPDLEFLVSWRVVGPATYAPEHRVQFMPVPGGKAHERGVKIRPSLPEVRIPEPTAEVLGDAGAVLRVAVERLPAEGELAAGWLVRCSLPAETAPGAYTGTLRISYPDGAELTDHEMIVNIRVQEPR
jgi:hypothetical protein